MYPESSVQNPVSSFQYPVSNIKVTNLRSDKPTDATVIKAVVNKMMRQAVADRVFPGAVLLVSVGSTVVYHQAFGKANLDTGQRVTRDTAFDLASLTKPLATTLAIMLLVQERHLKLDDDLGQVLPEFKSTSKSTITIIQLLNHTSGLPAYRPYYKQLRDVPDRARKLKLREMLLSEKLTGVIGEKTLYSDLGFMILCFLIEKISGMKLPEYLNQKVYGPLGFNAQTGRMLYFASSENTDQRWPVAATENCPWRQMMLQGVVHDDNAFVVGGYDGHAGLFGNAAGVHGLLDYLLRIYRGEEISPALFERRLLQQFLHRSSDAGRALGFDVPSQQGSASGSGFSADSVGHLGFTGTSFWMDLNRSIIVVLLTNRVHPSRDNEKIKSFRPLIHDAIMTSLESVSGRSGFEKK